MFQGGKATLGQDIEHRIHTVEWSKRLLVKGLLNILVSELIGYFWLWIQSVPETINFRTGNLLTSPTFNCQQRTSLLDCTGSD